MTIQYFYFYKHSIKIILFLQAKFIKRLIKGLFFFYIFKTEFKDRIALKREIYQTCIQEIFLYFQTTFLVINKLTVAI